MIGLVGVVSISTIIGHWVHRTEGMPNRDANSIVEKKSGEIGHDQIHKLIADKFHPCTPMKIRESALSWKGFLRCQQSKPNEPIELVLLGDSHAEHLFIGIAENMPNTNIAYYILGGSPFSSNPGFSEIYQEITNNKNIKTVVFSSYWKMIMDISMEQGDEDLSFLTLSINNSIQKLLESDKKVVITTDVPDFDFDPRACKYARLIGSSKCSFSLSIKDKGNSIPFNTLNTFVNKNMENFSVFDTYSLFCKREKCSMSLDDQLLFRDRNHLNINGSRYIGEKLAKYIIQNESIQQSSN